MSRASLLLLARAGALLLAVGVLIFAVGTACRTQPRAQQGARPGPPASDAPTPYLDVMPATKAGPPLPYDPPAQQAAPAQEQAPVQQQAPPSQKRR